MRARNFTLSVLWGLFLILLWTLFLFLFKGLPPFFSYIFLFLSSLISSLLIMPSFPFFLPFFYILSKFLLLFLHSYFSFLYNPGFLGYLLSGSIFLSQGVPSIPIWKSFQSFQILTRSSFSFLELAAVILGTIPLFFLRKKEKIVEPLIGNRYLKLLVFLFFAGLTIFLPFHLLSAISTASGLTSPFFFSFILLISSLATVFLFTGKFKARWKEINPKRTPGFLIILFPLIAYYFTVFLLSLPMFLSNLPVIIADFRYIWPFKPAIVFMYELTPLFLSGVVPFISGKKRKTDKK